LSKMFCNSKTNAPASLLLLMQLFFIMIFIIYFYTFLEPHRT
jgi:hypothetical protein